MHLTNLPFNWWQEREITTHNFQWMQLLINVVFYLVIIQVFTVLGVGSVFYPEEPPQPGDVSSLLGDLSKYIIPDASPVNTVKTVVTVDVATQVSPSFCGSDYDRCCSSCDSFCSLAWNSRTPIRTPLGSPCPYWDEEDRGFHGAYAVRQVRPENRISNFISHFNGHVITYPC